jgi:hypothetical protein
MSEDTTKKKNDFLFTPYVQATLANQYKLKIELEVNGVNKKHYLKLYKRFPNGSKSQKYPIPDDEINFLTAAKVTMYVLSFINSMIGSF